MKHRFETERSGSSIRNIIVSIVCFFAILGMFYLGVSSVSDRTIAQEKQTLELAINHGIAQCYALEGSYPESLAYLKDNYGLTYNEDKYFVDYQTIGSNIIPDVTVIEKEDVK